MRYVLTIAHPDGRTLTRTCDELRHVANETRWLLTSPQLKIPRPDAADFADRLTAAPPGTGMPHEESGLVFRVTLTEEP